MSTQTATDPATTPQPAAEPPSTIVDRLDALFDSSAATPAADPTTPADDPAAQTPDPASAGGDSMTDFLETKPAADPAADPAAAAAAEDDKLPEGMTEKAGHRWKELKSEVKVWKQKFEELSKKASSASPEVEQKLKDAEAQLAQLEELRQKVSTYEQEMTAVRLEATPEYQRQVSEPLEGLRSTVQDLADTYELDLEALNAAVVEDDRKTRVRKLAQLAETMLEPDRLKLYKAAEDFDRIVDLKVSLEENAEEALKRFENERAEVARRQSVEAIQRQKEASDQMWALMSRKLPLLSDETVAKAIRAEADTVDFESADPGIRAYAAYAGAALPRVVKVLREKEDRIASLEKQIGALKGSNPSAGSSTSSTPVKSTGSFLDAIEQGLGR